MTEEGKKYLADILIEDFTQETVSFAAYQSDRKTQSAVERQLAIIGEALNKFRKVEPKVTIEHDQQIIALRNRLVHAYGSIDNSIVWTIIKRHLPQLKKEIARK